MIEIIAKTPVDRNFLKLLDNAAIDTSQITSPNMIALLYNASCSKLAVEAVLTKTEP